jgi:hypothetical protein
MVLIGPTSRSADFSPQGLSEKVLTPLVVHSQIRPLGSDDGELICASANRDGSDRTAGWGVGAAAGSATAKEVAGNATAKEVAGDSAGSALKLRACRFLEAMLWIEPAPMAIAMLAITSPPDIHGSKSLSLRMSRLSLPHSGAYQL